LSPNVDAPWGGCHRSGLAQQKEGRPGQPSEFCRRDLFAQVPVASPLNSPCCQYGEPTATARSNLRLIAPMPPATLRP
jgi:hypothetical protein